MKRILLLMLCFAALVFCAACESQSQTEQNTDSRFKALYWQSESFDSITIIKDRDTGVQYLFIKNAYGAGVTPLLDSTGKPAVDTNGR